MKKITSENIPISKKSSEIKNNFPTPQGKSSIDISTLIMVMWALFFSSSWFIGIFPFSEENFIFFLDPDDFYLFSQFCQIQNLNPIGHPPCDVLYGSHLHLISFLFSILSFIYLPTKGMIYLSLKTLTLFFAAWSVFNLNIILRREKIENIYLILVNILLMSHPLFFKFSLFLKPDLNFVLFFLTLSFLSLQNHLQTHDFHFLKWSLFWAAGAAGVKWWGLLMVFPLTYFTFRSIQSSENFLDQFSKKNWVIQQGFFSFLMLGSFFYQIPLTKNFILITLNKPEKLSLLGKILPWAFFLLIATIATGFILFFTLFHYSQKKEKAHFYFPLFVSFWVFNGFIRFYILWIFPILFSTFLAKSIYIWPKYLLGFSQKGIMGPLLPSLAALITKINLNIFGWIKESFQWDNINPIYPLFYISTLGLGIRNKPLFRGIGLFIIPFVLFLFFLVSKKSVHSLFLIFPFLLLSIAIFFQGKNPLNLKKSFQFFFWVLILILTGSQSRKTYSLAREYLEIPLRIKSLNQNLALWLKNQNKISPKLIFINREFPLDSNLFGNFSIHFLNYRTLVDTVSKTREEGEDFPHKLLQNAVIVLIPGRYDSTLLNPKQLEEKGFLIKKGTLNSGYSPGFKVPTSESYILMESP